MLLRLPLNNHPIPLFAKPATLGVQVRLTRTCWAASFAEAKCKVRGSGNRIGATSSTNGDVHATSSPSESGNTTGVHEQNTAAVAVEKPKGILGWLQYLFFGGKLDKERLAGLGMGAVASYGFLSNLVYCSGMAVTWVMFFKQRGVSPLAPGQWPAYLAFYAGFWTINHFLRPFRFGLSVAMAPVFDRALDFVAKLTGLNKGKAFGLYLLLFGTACTALTFGSIAVFGGPGALSRAAPPPALP